MPPAIQKPKKKKPSAGGPVRGPGDREEGTSGQGKGKKLSKKAKSQNKRRNVRAIQKRLRKSGFRVSVDGIMGPETRSAIKAKRKGIRPRRWNRNHGKLAAPVGKAQHERAGGGGGGGAGRGRNRNRRRNRGAGTPKGFQFIKPGQLAKNMTNMEFAPIISELKNQRSQAQADRAAHLEEIGGWYGMLDEEIDEATAANIAAAEEAEADYEGAVSGIAGAFGGGRNPGAAEMAHYAIGQRGLLESLGQSQRAYDEDMGAIAEQMEIDARTFEGRQQDQTIRDINRQLVDTRRQRGRAMSVNRAQAQEQLLQQHAAVQNMRIAEQMSGIEMRQAKANLQSTRQENRIRSIQIRDLKDQIKAGSGGAVPPFGDLDPGTRAEIENRLRGEVTGSGGGILANPAQVLNAMGDALRRMGFDPRRDHNAKVFRDSILRSALARSHQRGQWRKWRIVNGRLLNANNKVVYRLG